MEQVAVIKTTVQNEKGKLVETVRNMMIPKTMWDGIVENGYHEANVTFELRKADKIKGKTVQLMPNKNNVDLKPGDKGQDKKVSTAGASTKDAGKKTETITVENADLEQLRKMYKKQFKVKVNKTWKEETIRGKLS